jgi:uncharacterized protein DUF6527
VSDAKVQWLDLGYERTDEPPERFGFACPKGNGRCEGLLIRLPERSPRPSWIWDGNREAPTFQPSINCKGCWHGYIRAGRCVDTNGNEEEPEPA